MIVVALHDLARFYKALGDATRLQLVALLARQRRGQALCVGRLAHDLGVTASAVSQHLRVLKDLGLVRRERQRYRIHYYLDDERLEEFGEVAREGLGSAFVLVSASDDHEFGLEEVDEMARRCCHQESCEHPDKLRGNPCECSKEQIKECHGDAEGHPCEKVEAEDRA